MFQKIKISLALVSAFFAFQLGAQNFVYKKYTWDASPKIHELTGDELESNYVKLKNKIILQYVYESSGELVMYETVHEIIHFNNEKGVEDMNKIYIPSSRILEEMDLKARTITPDGKVIPFNKNTVKKVDNVENTGAYIIFAMEGVEKGGEIEYIYTNKKTPNLFSYYRIQSDKIKKDISVDIYSPENLTFEAKGYNGFPDFTIDTAIENENHIFVSLARADALNDEKYSSYASNKMRFDIQLTYNTATSKSRLYSWESAGVNFYSTLYKFTKSELKAVDKLISKLGIEKLKTDEEKIRALELWMKTNVGTKETAEDLTIDKMLDVKYGDNLNFQKFYIASAQQLKIPVEIVITCDRTKRKFDSSFPSYNNLEEYLVYYPSIGKYLSSSDYSGRLGFPSPELTGNKGLFIKETTVGDMKTGVSKIKPIEPSPYTASHNNIYAKVTFKPESFIPAVSYKQEFAGYSAYYIQPGIPYMEETQRTQFLNEMAKFTGKETTVRSVKLSGDKSSDVMIAPMVIDSEVETPQLMEIAGNKLLFKVGELIGPQEELYDDKKRQSDGEILYTHGFERTIEIKIPEGYKLKNPDDIKIEYKYVVDGNVLSDFVSSYTIDNNNIKITVSENYKTLFYPKEKYEEWKKVINAAADFNKVVLIFEKI
jgi:hypothetical protein